MKTIEVTISPSGEIKLEVNGAVGSECLKLTEGLEKSLGEVLTREHKPEIYQTVSIPSFMEARNGY